MATQLTTLPTCEALTNEDHESILLPRWDSWAYNFGWSFDFISKLDYWG